MIHGIEALGQPSIGSVYDKTGTPDSGYAEEGPYHCSDCIHKTAMDEPFCVHPKVVGDVRLQDRLVLINGRPVVKIDMMHGCCEYVRQERHECDEDEDHALDSTAS
jgi:hypothetical protein